MKHSLLHFRSIRVMALLGAVAILLSACAGLVKEDRFFKGDKGEIISLLKEAMSEKDHNKALSKAHLAVEKNRSVNDPYLPFYTDMAFSYIHQNAGETEKGTQQMFKSLKTVMKRLKDEEPANVLYNMGVVLYDLRPTHLSRFPYKEYLEKLKHEAQINLGKLRKDILKDLERKREQAKLVLSLLDKFEPSVNNAIDGLLNENSQLLRESRKDMVYVLDNFEKLGVGTQDQYKVYLRVKEAAPTIYDVFLAYMGRDKSLYETSLRKSADLLNDVIKKALRSMDGE